MHEAQLHEHNCFITLTYNEENIPHDYGLKKSDFQKFMKRLRKAIPTKIRYFMCGEYGETNTLRPHYHACIFGYDFPDKQYYKNSKSGLPLYMSPLLTKVWRKGNCDIGNLTFESASYVASYVCKKLLGKDKNTEEYYNYYNRVDPDTGEQFIVQPEYVAMSRRPGIAKNWIQTYMEDTWRDDTVIVNRKPQLPPKYYLDQIDDEVQKTDIKRSRRLHAIRRNQDMDLATLQQREKVKKLEIKHKRNLGE